MRLTAGAAAADATSTLTVTTDPTTVPAVSATSRRRITCVAGAAPGEVRVPDIPGAPIPPLRHYEIALSKLLLLSRPEDVEDSAAEAAATAGSDAAGADEDADATMATPRMTATTTGTVAAQVPAPPTTQPQTPLPVYHALRFSADFAGRENGGSRRSRGRVPPLPPPLPPLATVETIRVDGAGGSSPPPPPPRGREEEVGQIVDPARAAAKEDQVRSVLQCLEYVLVRRSSNRTDALAVAPATARRGGMTIVDMGGGSGHLAIPAALLHPSHRVVLIDLNRRSIDLLKIKAARTAVEDFRMQQQLEEFEDVDDQNDDFLANNPSLPLEVTAISNLYAVCGSIEQFLLCEEQQARLPFEVGLALHLCGQSTDVALRACTQQRAALVAAPCCVGKISTTRHNPYVWQATQSNTSTIKYPQSKLYKVLLNDAAVEDSATTTSLWWNALASAADDSTRHVSEEAGWRRPASGDEDNYANQPAMDHPDPDQASDMGSSSDRNHRRCCCRAAKMLVEWDRCLYLREQGYETVLTRMVPIFASPKHDIIVAIPKAWRKVSSGTRIDGNGMTDDMGDESSDDKRLVVDHDAVEDLARTREYLRVASSGFCGGCIEGNADSPQVHGWAVAIGGDDGMSNGTWSKGEVAEVRELLAAHFALSDARASSDHVSNGLRQSDDVYYFPKGMGRGRRKLVHYVAGTLGLEHWSHGKKQGTGKTVAVALPGTRRRLQSNSS